MKLKRAGQRWQWDEREIELDMTKGNWSVSIVICLMNRRIFFVTIDFRENFSFFYWWIHLFLFRDMSFNKWANAYLLLVRMKYRKRSRSNKGFVQHRARTRNSGRKRETDSKWARKREWAWNRRNLSMHQIMSYSKSSLSHYHTSAKKRPISCCCRTQKIDSFFHLCVPHSFLSLHFQCTRVQWFDFQGKQNWSVYKIFIFVLLSFWSLFTIFISFVSIASNVIDCPPRTFFLLFSYIFFSISSSSSDMDGLYVFVALPLLFLLKQTKKNTREETKKLFISSFLAPEFFGYCCVSLFNFSAMPIPFFLLCVSVCWKHKEDEKSSINSLECIQMNASHIYDPTHLNNYKKVLLLLLLVMTLLCVQFTRHCYCIAKEITKAQNIIIKKYDSIGLYWKMSHSKSWGEDIISIVRNVNKPLILSSFHFVYIYIFFESSYCCLAHYKDNVDLSFHSKENIFIILFHSFVYYIKITLAPRYIFHLLFTTIHLAGRFDVHCPRSSNNWSGFGFECNQSLGNKQAAIRNN